MNQYFFYNRRLSESKNGKLCPENRLLPMMFGSFLFPAGLFILGWSSKRNTHWTIPTSGAVFVGFAYYTIFQAALNYLVDTFERWGASAIAANTFLRSILAAAFPAIVIPMYKRMGTGPASSVFASVATLMIPIPFAFWYWGEWLRARGQYSASLDYDPDEQPGHADD
jgi:DHA1 family multidrug resistance protein-like MFS transporter